MQAVVFLAIPGGMAFAIWRAYRRAGSGGYDAGGRIRWEPGDAPPDAAPDAPVGGSDA